RDKLVTGVQTCALPISFVALGDSARLREARIVVTHSLAPLAALRRRVDAAFVAAALLTAAIALLLASWLSSLISRPLGELARRRSEERRVGRECACGVS